MENFELKSKTADIVWCTPERMAQACRVLPIDEAPWGRDASDATKAQAQIAYDSKGIHLRFAAQEFPILSTKEKMNDSVWQDSCLEFFFSPMPQSDPRYFNFECNPLGAIYLSIGYDRQKRELIHLLDHREYFCIRTEVEKDRWSVSYTIPFEFVRQYFSGFKPDEFHLMRGNFYKCADALTPPHYLSWNPITWETPDFHRPECFGTLRFIPKEH